MLKPSSHEVYAEELTERLEKVQRDLAAHPLTVSAVIVTRGDVPLDEVLAPVAVLNEVIVYDNSKRKDLGVYGRYAALEEITNPVAFVVDDDVLLSPETVAAIANAYRPGRLVANMPEPHRRWYPDSALVGFGAVFDRHLPARAFKRYQRAYGQELQRPDVIFSALTPRTILSLPVTNMPWANAPDRASKQKGHTVQREKILNRCRAIRGKDDDQR